MGAEIFAIPVFTTRFAEPTTGCGVTNATNISPTLPLILRQSSDFGLDAVTVLGRAAQHAYTSTHGMHTVNRRYARTARRVPTSEQMMIIAATAAGRLRRELGKRPYRG